ncbi:MAG: ATP-binding protein [Rhodobacterales bacterium]
MPAAAILDRLLHHSHVVMIQGDSDRQKMNRMAGIVGFQPVKEAATAIPHAGQTALAFYQEPARSGLIFAQVGQFHFGQVGRP